MGDGLSTLHRARVPCTDHLRRSHECYIYGRLSRQMLHTQLCVYQVVVKSVQGCKWKWQTCAVSRGMRHVADFQPATGSTEKWSDCLPHPAKASKKNRKHCSFSWAASSEPYMQPAIFPLAGRRRRECSRCSDMPLVGKRAYKKPAEHGPTGFSFSRCSGVSL